MTALGNIVATATLRFSTILFGLLISVLLARLMGTSGFGVYSYVIACVTLIGLPLQAGIPTLTMREAARLRATGDFGLLKGLFFRAVQFLAALTFFFMTAAFLLVSFSSTPALPTYKTVILLGSALVPLIAWMRFFSSALLGADRLIAGQVSEAAIRPGVFIMLLVFLATFPQLDMTPERVLACAALAIAVSILFAAASFLRTYMPLLRHEIAQYKTSSWLRSMLPLAFFGITTTLLAQTDILLLGLFDTAETVGIYKVGVVGSMLIAFGLKVVNTVNAPKYAACHARKDIVRLEELAFDGARLASIFAVILFAVYLVLGRQLIEFAFGVEYVSAVPTLMILSIAQITNCFAGSVGTILNTTNLETRAAKAVAVAASLNVILNLILIPQFGASGAAVATGISLAISNVLMWMSLKRSLGIDVSAWGRVQ